MEKIRGATSAPNIDTQHPLHAAIQRRCQILAVQNIEPVIRLAHRIAGPINIQSRIIFDHELVLIVRGTGELAFAGQTFAFGPRDLFVIPPFSPHEFRSHEACEPCEHVAVHFDLAADVPRRRGLLQARKPYHVALTQGLVFPLHLAVLHDDPIIHGMDRIVEMRGSVDGLDQLASRMELLEILLLLLKRQRRAGQARRTAQGNCLPPSSQKMQK